MILNLKIKDINYIQKAYTNNMKNIDIKNLWLNVLWMAITYTFIMFFLAPHISITIALHLTASHIFMCYPLMLPGIGCISVSTFGLLCRNMLPFEKAVQQSLNLINEIKDSQSTETLSQEEFDNLTALENEMEEITFEDPATETSPQLIPDDPASTLQMWGLFYDFFLGTGMAFALTGITHLSLGLPLICMSWVFPVFFTSEMIAIGMNIALSKSHAFKFLTFDTIHFAQDTVAVFSYPKNVELKNVSLLRAPLGHEAPLRKADRA